MTSASFDHRRPSISQTRPPHSLTRTAPQCLTFMLYLPPAESSAHVFSPVRVFSASSLPQSIAPGSSPDTFTVHVRLSPAMHSDGHSRAIPTLPAEIRAMMADSAGAISAAASMTLVPVLFSKKYRPDAAASHTAHTAILFTLIWSVRGRAP